MSGRGLRAKRALHLVARKKSVVSPVGCGLCGERAALSKGLWAALLSTSSGTVHSALAVGSCAVHSSLGSLVRESHRESPAHGRVHANGVTEIIASSTAGIAALHELVALLIGSSTK